jgi:tol-pal system protein YbgF
MKAVRLAALAALLPLAGCLATRQDLEKLQTRMDNDRAEQNRQIQALITRTQAMLDSLSSQNARMRADVANRLLQIDRQLVQIQSLSGQSQQQIRDLQRQIEQRAAEARQADEAADSAEVVLDRPAETGTSTRTSAERPSTERPSSSGSDRTASTPPPRTTTPPRTTPPRPRTGGVSADEAYEAAMGAFRRGSMSTARSGFQEFLSIAPDDDRAPDAQFYVGETYTRDPDAAIAAYQRVVERWPRSTRAPTALLRIARLEIARGDRTQARAHLNQILRGYPRSDEAEEARTQLDRLGSR